MCSKFVPVVETNISFSDIARYNFLIIFLFYTIPKKQIHFPSFENMNKVVTTIHSVVIGEES